MNWIRKGIDETKEEEENKKDLYAKTLEERKNKDISFMKNFQNQKNQFITAILHDYAKEFGKDQFFEINHELLDQTYTETDPYSDNADKRTLTQYTLFWEIKIYKKSMFREKAKIDKTLCIKFFIRRYSHEYRPNAGWHDFQSEGSKFEKMCHIIHKEYIPLEKEFLGAFPFNLNNEELKKALVCTLTSKPR